MNPYKSAIFDLDGVSTLLCAASDNLSVVHDAAAGIGVHIEIVNALAAVDYLLRDLVSGMRGIISKAIEEGAQ